MRARMTPGTCRPCAVALHRTCARSTPVTGLCVGCLRTLDEIAAWGVLDDEAKRAVCGARYPRAGVAAGANGPVRTGTDAER